MDNWKVGRGGGQTVNKGHKARASQLVTAVVC